MAVMSARPGATASITPPCTVATAGRSDVQASAGAAATIAAPPISASPDVSVTVAPMRRPRRRWSSTTRVGTTLMVQTIGWKPSSWAVSVVVPARRASSIPVPGVNCATAVSATAQAIGRSGIGVESAASPRASNRRAVPSGTTTGPLLARGTRVNAATGFRTTIRMRPVMP